jgi:uncharacterized protein YecE (DUF72 family)
MAIYIGTSGWSYNHWQGVLYPHDIPLRDRLAYYVAHFGTVEVNNTFYRWPPNRNFISWRQRVPEGFRMTIKASRALTHSKRLYAPEIWLNRMADSLAFLGDKMGILLVQLPPGLSYDYARLEYFLKQISAGLKVAIEFRHDSWHCEQIFSLLEQHGVAYCVMSGAHLPCVLRVTAPFVYARLHGPDTNHLYGGSYSENELCWWADRIREWQDGDKDVWVYFNNDGDGNAVRNAQRLKQLLGC